MNILAGEDIRHCPEKFFPDHPENFYLDGLLRFGILEVAVGIDFGMVPPESLPPRCTFLLCMPLTWQIFSQPDQRVIEIAQPCQNNCNGLGTWKWA